jgi:phage-related minor tail protein
MQPRRLPSLRYALVAVTLGTFLLATPAVANSPEPRENSFPTAVDRFVAYLKSETNEAMIAAVRLARQNKDQLAAAKSRIETEIAAFRAALSGQKERLPTLGKDMSTTWEAWRDAAVSSWAKVERRVHDTLDWIAAWVRNQSLSDQHPEIPV